MAKSSCPCKSTDSPEYCLDLSYMHTLLRLGYEVEKLARDRDRQVDLRVGPGFAAIAMAGAELTCKA